MCNLPENTDPLKGIVVSSAQISEPPEFDAEAELDCLRHLHSPLDVQEPEAFQRYLDLFYTYWPRTPYNIRTGYDRGFLQQNKAYKYGEGTYPLYCHPGLIAEHLDYDHWCFLHPAHTPTEHFWLAMWAPKRSTLKALDLDNKDNILGYTQAVDGPLMPMARLPLERFRELKRIYDEFPGHIWCISSETLGLHVWEKFPVPVAISDIHETNRPRFARIGLNVPEIHPMFGRCFRRPFGQDYCTITEGGLLTDWIDQLDYFEHNATTPSFTAIFQAMRGKLLSQWTSYDRSRLLNRNRTPMPRPVTGDQLRQELEEIDAWAAKGFPDHYEPPVSISMAASEPASPAGRQVSPCLPVVRSHWPRFVMPSGCRIANPGRTMACLVMTHSFSSSRN